MATTSKTLYRGVASGTTTTAVYTVPASTTTVVTNIAVTNTLAGAATFTLAMGPSSAEITLHAATTIAANTTVYIDLKQVLTAGQRITGGASSNPGINFHIAGVEIV